MVQCTLLGGGQDAFRQSSAICGETISSQDLSLDDRCTVRLQLLVSSFSHSSLINKRIFSVEKRGLERFGWCYR